MSSLTNALFWGCFLIGLAVSLVIEAIVTMAFLGTLAVCSAWCWCKEKIKGKKIYENNERPQITYRGK